MPSPSEGEGGRYSGRVGVGATHGGGEASVMAAVAAVPVWLIEQCRPHPPLRGYFPHEEGRARALRLACFRGPPKADGRSEGDILIP